MAINPLALPSSQAFTPNVDWSPLANLGQVYQKTQQDQLRQQTLASLGQGGNDAQTLLRSGDLTLAQLGVGLQNTQYQHGRDAKNDARQSANDAFNQRMEQARLDLQARTQARLEDPTPAGFQKRPDGSGLAFIPGGPQDPATIAAQNQSNGKNEIQAAVNQRIAVADQIGMSKDHPGYQSFIATGKMPREDAQPLTAGDKEAIRTADDAIVANRAGIDSLNRAKQLSKQAFSGPGAGYAGAAASYLGETSDIGKRGIATENLTNEVMTNALGQLKAIFGGNPTEGERRILLDLQGSASKPDSVRQAIFDRAKAAAEKRLEFSQKRADELRGNTYYKPKTVQAGETAGSTVMEPPKIGQLQQGYRFKGGDPSNPDSWVKAQ